MIHQPLMPHASEFLATLPLKVFAQRNFVAEFLPDKNHFYTKNSNLRFLTPLRVGWLKSNFLRIGVTLDQKVRAVFCSFPIPFAFPSLSPIFFPSPYLPYSCIFPSLSSPFPFAFSFFPTLFSIFLSLLSSLPSPPIHLGVWGAL